MFDRFKSLFAKREEPKERLNPIRRRLILRGLRFTFWHYIPSPYLDIRTRTVWNFVNSFLFGLIVFVWTGLPIPKLVSLAATLAALRVLVSLLALNLHLFVIDLKLRSAAPRRFAGAVNTILFSNTSMLLIGGALSFLAFWVALALHFERQNVLTVESWVVRTVETYVINRPYTCIAFILVGTGLMVVDVFSSVARFSSGGQRTFLVAKFSFLRIAPTVCLLTSWLYLIRNGPSLAGLVVALMGLESILWPFLTVLSWLALSGVVATFSMMLNLVQVRANVLALTTLAATIPFLNSDSWQLVSQLEWRWLAGVTFFIYIFPILLLVSKWDLIRDEMYVRGWTPGQTLTGETLVGELEAVGLRFDDAIREAVDVGLAESKVPTRFDFFVVMLKAAAKWVVFVLLTPAAVLVFILILFNMIVGDGLLKNWLADSSAHAPSTILGVSVSYYANIRVKAAAFLALLSAGSTIVTLFNSREELAAFIKEEFVKDIWQDKYLLSLYRSAETGFDIISKRRAVGEAAAPVAGE